MKSGNNSHRVEKFNALYLLSPSPSSSSSSSASSTVTALGRRSLVLLLLSPIASLPSTSACASTCALTAASLSLGVTSSNPVDLVVVTSPSELLTALLLSLLLSLLPSPASSLAVSWGPSVCNPNTDPPAARSFPCPNSCAGPPQLGGATGIGAAVTTGCCCLRTCGSEEAPLLPPPRDPGLREDSELGRPTCVERPDGPGAGLVPRDRG
jgi:hypothetical protein